MIYEWMVMWCNEYCMMHYVLCSCPTFLHGHSMGMACTSFTMASGCCWHSGLIVSITTSITGGSTRTRTVPWFTCSRKTSSLSPRLHLPWLVAIQKVAIKYIGERLLPSVNITDFSNGLRSGMQYIRWDIDNQDKPLEVQYDALWMYIIVSWYVNDVLWCCIPCYMMVYVAGYASYGWLGPSGCQVY